MKYTFGVFMQNTFYFQTFNEHGCCLKADFGTNIPAIVPSAMRLIPPLRSVCHGGAFSTLSFEA
jgi:hypothetical protein